LQSTERKLPLLPRNSSTKMNEHQRGSGRFQDKLFDVILGRRLSGQNPRQEKKEIVQSTEQKLPLLSRNSSMKMNELQRGSGRFQNKLFDVSLCPNSFGKNPCLVKKDIVQSTEQKLPLLQRNSSSKMNELQRGMGRFQDKLFNVSLCRRHSGQNLCQVKKEIRGNK
jgi:hypothetical protein